MSEVTVARARPRVGAFFDMDKTLIAQNSGTLMMKYRYERGEIGNLDLLKGVAVYLQYKLGVLDIRSWAQSVLAEYRGKHEAEIERQALEWFDAWVEPALYPEAEQLVREHEAAGHIVAIVSGATKFVVRPLAARLGIPHMLYTRLEVEGGCFTGRVIDPICFEEGKIYWLQQFIDERGVDLARSWFYTDSITDLPLMDLVGHAVAVNPDPFLVRAARRRGWPVKFFERPGEAEISP